MSLVKTMSQRAFDKLYLFCSWVNKPMGICHPFDEMRWFDFICQTVDDGKVIDTSTLEDILQDEGYLGKGNTLSKRHAQKLAAMYERDCRFLQYCEKK